MWSPSVLRSQARSARSFSSNWCKPYWRHWFHEDFWTTEFEKLALLGPKSGSGHMGLHITPKLSQPTVTFGGGNVMVWGCFSANRTGIISTSSFTHALWSWNLCDRAAWAGTNAHTLGTRFYPGTRHPVRAREPLRLAARRASTSAVWKWKNRNEQGWGKWPICTQERLAEARWCPNSPNDLGDFEGFANKTENNENPVCLQAFQMW